ncbi:MAG: hypothetical protein HY749_16335 [Gammaproteobacteria bacterium]|nr:hypothetical protein [Gammaproteobacteria bacterium]
MARIGPFAGIDNVTARELLKPDHLQAGVNVDVMDSKRVKRRVGRATFSAGGADSLYVHDGVFVFRRGTELRRMRPSGQSDVIASGLARRPCYWGVKDRIYWSDGLQTGVIVRGLNEAWGIAPPPTQPDYAAAPGGNLPRASYRYALTFERDGQESGTGPARDTAEIEGAITFSNIAVPTGADCKHLYLSYPDGRRLHRLMTLAPGTTTATYAGTAAALGAPLETQFMQPPPAGSAIAEHHGRMLVAIGEFLLFSPPYRGYLFDPVHMNYRFGSRITMVAPVEGGVYVGTEKTIEFLAGDDIATATRYEKAAYGAVEGTLDYVSADQLGVVSLPGKVALFAAQAGICVGGIGGAFHNLTTGRYAYPVASRGAARVIQEENATRLVIAMRGIS